MIHYRTLHPDELARIGEIDRSERVTRGYLQHGAELEQVAVDWDIPPWQAEGEGSHSVAHKAAAWRAIALQGIAYGAWNGERLVGVGVLRWRLEGDMAELAVLHVDRAHRERGIGRRLTETMFAAARASGATAIYVSAADSARAVCFYQSMGFRPTATPHPELLAAEPNDIHMTRSL